MARNSILRSLLLCRAPRNKNPSRALCHSLRSNNPSPFEALMSSKPFSSISRCSTPATLSPFSKLPFPQARSFSSPSGSSNIVPIKSENEFNASLTKVQDESLPAIFYFTAVWCGPCRFISPVIGELSEQYPHVKTYKIDIDEEGLGSVLSKLNISAVPTLHFFKNGEKADEVIGADIARLKNTVEKLYKQD